MAEKEKNGGGNIASATLSTLNKYKRIAQQPNKRPLLLKDKGCLSFLVYVLDDACDEIVLEALEILNLLTEQADHCAMVQKSSIELGEMLAKIGRSSGHSKSKGRIVSLVGLLGSRLNKEEAKATFKTPLAPIQQKRRVRPVGRFIARPAGAKAKTMTFKLPSCFNAEARDLFEREILHWKGVISVYFNSQNGRLQVRAKAELTELDKDVAELLINCCADCDVVYQIVKDSTGEEHLVKFESRNETTLDNSLANKTAQGDLPEYLSESFGEHSPERGGLSLARTDSGSLARNSDSNKGWLNNITGFFSKSFYW